MALIKISARVTWAVAVVGFLLSSTLEAQPAPASQSAPRAEQVAPGIQIDRSATGKETVKVDLSIRPINSISLNIAPRTRGDVPPNLALENMRGELPHLLQDRPYEPWNFYWTATAFCHRPLYFEQVNVERYGHNAGCLQPAISAVHFFGTIPILPYKIGMDHPNKCIYTLGHSRPGDCNAWERHELRWSYAGIVAQGAAATGLVFLIP